MSRLVDQPSSMSSQASESSSSGCVGGVPRTAEIARGIDDELAEQMAPHAVNPNAGGERIVAAGDGLGHFAAAAAVLERDRLVIGR